ncbi:MAG: valine--tRNA ligase [Tepidisphaeraceae bacterium]
MELAKTYDAKAVQQEVTAAWDAVRAWHAEPDPSKKPYVIVIPPPNVTGALHLGHALNNTLQDILVRWRRMAGDNAVWIPGTDHAGIATQSVVEKRVLAEEGKRRTDFERDAFVQKIQSWKDEYEARILGQLKSMACSCDWDRVAFTMDEARSKAVREAFFRLFRDGLIYRGKRLVNWDPVTQTALADDEVENEEVDGFFYYLKYPVCDANGALLDAHGRPSVGVENALTITVATTRPETMLGDTAVAVNPKDPRAAALRGKFVKLPIVDRIIPIIEDEYVVLPVAHGGDEKDPKAQFSSGFLKVTPAHDPNDYDLGQKYKLGMINVMAPDASISLDHGWGALEAHQKDNPHVKPLIGLVREKAREHVVAWFKHHGLLEQIKPYKHSVGHSYRSHVPVEPYLSDQWYVAVRKPIPWLADSGLIEGTEIPKNSLAGLALSALRGTGVSPVSSEANHGRDARATNDGGLKLVPERYEKTYDHWNANLRDWCISRQLWWGHRIPVWSYKLTAEGQQAIQALMRGDESKPIPLADKLALDVYRELTEKHADSVVSPESPFRSGPRLTTQPFGQIVHDPTLRLCIRSDDADRFADIERFGFTRDPDVLDTWFSSALWPLSTLGWPEAATEAATPTYAPSGNSPLPTPRSPLDVWNPTSTLCTAREIITLWVSRMVMFNRYMRGSDAQSQIANRKSQIESNPQSAIRNPQLPLPFTDVFVHAMIQDGHGQKMSKSYGNSVDPADVIDTHGVDGMRFTLASMSTMTQDVRMPVDLVDPHSGEIFTPEYFTNKSGLTVMKPVQTHKGKPSVSFYGVFSAEATPTKEMPLARNTSSKFDLGRNFCNKLWNAGRFVLGQLAKESTEGSSSSPSAFAPASLPDAWILSRLAKTIQAATDALTNYRFDLYATACYDFVWRDFCDWYLEATKPAMRDPARRPQTAHILATCLDVSLRLMHPVIPLITEKLYWALNDINTPRGIEGLECASPGTNQRLAMTAPFPQFTEATRKLASDEIEEAMMRLQDIVVAIRNVRNDQKVDPKKKVPVHLSCSGALATNATQNREFIESLAVCTLEQVGADLPEPAGSAKTTAAGATIYVAGVIDAGSSEKRKGELVKQIAALEGRLNNPGYADRAPAKLVEQTKQQLAEAKAELAKLG